MARLFTYTIPYDEGSAPNPFHGMCSLAICKPGIRNVAIKGDWVAGFGAKSRELAGHLVYAMCVDESISLAEYDRRALTDWPHRLPNTDSLAMQDRLGDCIYDYTSGLPVQRKNSVHDAGNAPTDLKGNNVLISRDFYYFGKSAIFLPDHLRKILHQTQGHKSNCNASHFDAFVTWVRTLNKGQNGWPDYIAERNTLNSCGGCVVRINEGENDYECISDLGRISETI